MVLTVTAIIRRHRMRPRGRYGYGASPSVSDVRWRSKRKPQTMWRGFICRLCGKSHKGDDNAFYLPRDEQGEPQICPSCMENRCARTLASLADTKPQDRADWPEWFDRATLVAVARLFLSEFTALKLRQAKGLKPDRILSAQPYREPSPEPIEYVLPKHLGPPCPACGLPKSKIGGQICKRCYRAGALKQWEAFQDDRE